MKRYFIPLSAFVILAAAWFLLPVSAQVPSSSPPYNTDIGAVIINTLRVAGTTLSATQTNLDKTGIVCVLSQTATSGQPSVTFAIQSFDAATATWNTLATSSAVTAITVAGAVGATVRLQPGLIAADVPSLGVGKSLALPRTWRVSQTIAAVGGTLGPASTGAIGCNMLAR